MKKTALSHVERFKGPHRPDAIRKRDAIFPFLKVNKTEHEKKFCNVC